MSAIQRRLDKVERGLFPQQQTAAIGQFVERGAEEDRYRLLLGKLAAGVLTDEEDFELAEIQFFALGRMRGTVTIRSVGSHRLREKARRLL